MLRGQQVVLRPVERDDLARLHAWKIDMDLWMRTDDTTPVPLNLDTYTAEWERTWAEPSTDAGAAATFAIEADGRLVGRCVLFAVDLLGRTGCVGVTIGDAADRGRGLGGDALATLLAYAFRSRNLRRVWLEVLASNEPALRSYRRLGFKEEGRRREHAWVDLEGRARYEDVVLMGILRTEWEPAGAGS